MAVVRAFVACVFDPPAMRRIGRLAQGLREPLDAARWRVSWVPPSNRHLTLKFLGEIESTDVPRISAALDLAAAAHAPFDLEVGGVGAFHDRGSPRVLFASVTRGQERLAALASSVEDALATLGAPREARPFHAHVTLARVRALPAEGPSLEDLAPTGKAACIGPAHVEEIVLYRSELRREASAYHALSRHPLVGTPAVGLSDKK